jgi:hypothetical protein
MPVAAAPDAVAPEPVQVRDELAPVVHVDASNEDIGEIFRHRLIVLGENEEVGVALSAELVGLIATDREELAAEHPELLERFRGVAEEVHELAVEDELVGPEVRRGCDTGEHDAPVLEVGVEVGKEHLGRAGVRVVTLRCLGSEPVNLAEVGFDLLYCFDENELATSQPRSTLDTTENVKGCFNSSKVERRILHRGVGHRSSFSSHWLGLFPHLIDKGPRYRAYSNLPEDYRDW